MYPAVKEFTIDYTTPSFILSHNWRASFVEDKSSSFMFMVNNRIVNEFFNCLDESPITRYHRI